MPVVRNFLSLKRWRLNVTDSLDPIGAIEEKVVVEAITADVMEVPREVDLVEAIITEKIPLVVTTLTRVAPTVMGEVAITREEAEEEGAVVDTKGARYIVEDLTPEWDGGSRGRVKTKGKRGTGWTT